MVFWKKKKKNEGKEEEIKKVNKNLIRVKVWRKHSSDTYFEIARFEAEESKQLDGSIMAINNNLKFKEDINFKVDDVYTLLEIELNLDTKDYQEKKSILKDKIIEQRELLKKLRTNIELNNDYNFIDEEYKLKVYKTYFDGINGKGRGAYVRIEKDGVRTYEFESVDGMLKPFYFGSSDNYVNTDKTLKIKHYIRQDEIHKSMMEQMNMPKISKNMLTVLAVILSLLIVGNMFWAYYNSVKGADIEARASNSATTCANNIAKASNMLMNPCVSQCLIEQSKTQNNINTEKQNNNINLDPSSIIKK